MALKLTPEQREELEAIAEITGILGKPTFLMKHHWRNPDVGPLVRRRLITWKRFTDGTFGPKFRAVELTAAGRAALAAA